MKAINGATTTRAPSGADIIAMANGSDAPITPIGSHCRRNRRPQPAACSSLALERQSLAAA